MKVLVIGHTGFIGRNLMNQLKKFGHETYGFSRTNGSMPSGNIDAIINCAGEITNVEYMVSANIGIPQLLIELTKGKRNKFIHIGSSAEYGPIDSPRIETMQCSPSNLYDATKLTATKLCQFHAYKYDLDICIARPSNIYGPNDTPRKFIPSIYRSYIEGKTIDLYEGKNDWIFIDDFVSGLIALLDAPKKKTQGDIVNFSSGQLSTNVEVLKCFERAFGTEVKHNYKKGLMSSHHSMNWSVDNTKARTKYGWSPKFTLGQGISEYVLRQWFTEDKG